MCVCAAQGQAITLVRTRATIAATTNAQSDRRTRVPAAGEMKKSTTIIYIHTVDPLLWIFHANIDVVNKQNKMHPNNHDTDHVTAAYNVKSS